MPKIKRNKHFHEQELKMREHFSSQKIIPSKSRMYVEEFDWIFGVIKDEARCRDLETSQFIRWLIWRYLSAYNKIPVNIDKYEPKTVDINEKKSYIKIPKHLNGLSAYRKAFGEKY